MNYKFFTKLTAGNSTGYKGVHLRHYKRTNRTRFTAVLYIPGVKSIWLGSYVSAAEAARAYNEAAVKYLKEEAVLNSVMPLFGKVEKDDWPLVFKHPRAYRKCQDCGQAVRMVKRQFRCDGCRKKKTVEFFQSALGRLTA